MDTNTKTNVRVGAYMTLEEQLQLHQGVLTDARALMISYTARRESLVQQRATIDAKIDQLDRDFATAPERAALAEMKVAHFRGLIAAKPTPAIKKREVLAKMVDRRSALLAKLKALDAEIGLTADDYVADDVAPSSEPDGVDRGEEVLAGADDVELPAADEEVA